jgi:enoyl-CoA hydratase
MSYETVRFEEVEAAVGLVTLNRPHRLNAMNLTMVDDLHRLLGLLEGEEDIRVLIITGEGRGFCAGADLKEAAQRWTGTQRERSAANHLVYVQRRYSSLIPRMRAIPQPIIAAVNGPAAGAGMCVALASDVIIAAPEALFIASFINIGLSGGELGTSYFLPRLVGATRAAEILMTGRSVSGEEAERIGLAVRCVPREKLLESALETARAMLGKSRLGLRFTKEALEMSRHAPSVEAAIEMEDRNQSILIMTREFLDSLESFQRRKEEV